MADFWLQFRFKKKSYDEIILNQVAMVYDDNEVVEPPSPTGNTAFLHVTGCPPHVTKERLQELLAAYLDKSNPIEIDDFDGSEIPVSQQYNIRKCIIDIDSLPNPYHNQLIADLTTDIPFGILLSRLFHRGLKRIMMEGDF